MQRGAAILSVWVPTGAVLALINAVSLKGWLSVFLLIVNLSYSIWRWRRDFFVVCEGCRMGNVPSNCPLPMGRRPWWCPKKL